jgi:threonine dehydratase
VAEPSGAASVAAVLGGAVDRWERLDGPLVAIVSGGNIAADTLAGLVQTRTTSAERRPARQD